MDIGSVFHQTGRDVSGRRGGQGHRPVMWDDCGVGCGLG